MYLLVIIGPGGADLLLSTFTIFSPVFGLVRLRTYFTVIFKKNFAIFCGILVGVVAKLSVAKMFLTGNLLYNIRPM